MINKRNITNKLREIFKLYSNEFETDNFIELLPKYNGINSFLSIIGVLMPEFIDYNNIILTRDNIESYTKVNKGFGNYFYKKSENFIPEQKNNVVEFQKINNLFFGGEFLYGITRNIGSNIIDEDEDLFMVFFEILIYTWKIKLKEQYPNRTFAFGIFDDDLYGEEGVYVTFWEADLDENILIDKKNNHEIDIILRDVVEWYTPSQYIFASFKTYMNNVSCMEGIYSVVYLIFPEIIEYKNCFFLKNNLVVYQKVKSFNKLYENQYIGTENIKINYKFNKDKKVIEQYNNLINISTYFSDDKFYGEFNDSGNNDIRLVKKVIEILIYFWKMRLKDLFPNKNFKVEMLDSPFDQEGLCVTFWEGTE